MIFRFRSNAVYNRKCFKSQGFPWLFFYYWEQRKLGDIVNITMGQSPDGNTYSEVPSKFILVQGNADLKNGWVVPRVWTTQLTKKCSAGDLIMSVRAPAGAMGKTAFDAVIGRGVAAIKGNEFIFQTLCKLDSDGFWKQLSAGSTFESLNSDSIKNADIIIPSDAEQFQIGKFFEKIDTLITLHQCNCNEDGLFYAYYWEQRKLGELGHARSGVGFPESEQGGNEGIPFYKVSDMNLEGNDNELIHANNYVTSIQICRNNWNPIEEVPAIFFAKVGAAVLLNRKRICNYPFLLDNNTMAYSLNPGTWDVDFSKALFDTIDLTSLVQVGALPSYNSSDVESMEVFIPSISEQNSIGQYFKKLDTLITLHQCELLIVLFGGKTCRMKSCYAIIMHDG